MKQKTKRQERNDRKIKYLMFSDTNEIIVMSDNGHDKKESQSKKIIMPKLQTQSVQRETSQLPASQELTRALGTTVSDFQNLENFNFNFGDDSMSDCDCNTFNEYFDGQYLL